MTQLMHFWERKKVFYQLNDSLNTYPSAVYQSASPNKAHFVHTIYLRFYNRSNNKQIIPQNEIRWLPFVTETGSVLCEQQTKSL
jgi:hypothetical protein